MIFVDVCCKYALKEVVSLLSKTMKLKCILIFFIACVKYLINALNPKKIIIKNWNILRSQEGRKARNYRIKEKNLIDY